MKDLFVEYINIFLIHELPSTFIFIYNLIIKFLGESVGKN